jgi:GNAT superfamily N-acetyltransferase
VWGYDAAFMARCRPELVVHAEDVRAGRVVVAERAGVPLGFSLVRLEADPPELEMLFVDPAAIGSGAGTALLQDALARAGAAGVAALVVESDPNAEAFYRARGATRIGERASPSTGRSLPLLRITT